VTIKIGYHHYHHWLIAVIFSQFRSAPGFVDIPLKEAASGDRYLSPLAASFNSPKKFLKKRVPKKESLKKNQ
jgi:hypothetical protein